MGIKHQVMSKNKMKKYCHKGTRAFLLCLVGKIGGFDAKSSRRMAEYLRWM
jgi:hypothetical protein